MNFNLKKLSIVELLGKLERAYVAKTSGISNNYEEEISNELWSREPFAYISERFEEDNEELGALRQEVIRLKRLLKEHEHLKTGEAVVEID